MAGETTGDRAIIEWVNQRLAAVLLSATGVVIGGDVGAVATGDIIYADSTPLWAVRTAGAQDTILTIDAGGVPVWTANVPLASLADPTRGDVMIGNATPVWSGLAIGAVNTVFVSDGTDPSWSATLPLAAVPAHDLLSAQHGDSVASSRTQGDIIIGTAVGWDDLAIGGSATYLRSDGTDPAWSAILTADLPALPTPGTLTVATANSGTAPHLHTITTSASPGGAASILASAADGGLQLIRFGVGVDPSVDGQIYIYENSSSIAPKLKIEQDGAGDAALTWLLTGSDQYSMGIDNSITGNPLVISAGADLNTSPVMTIESGGDVGIGTTAPDVRLVVREDGSTHVNSLRLQNLNTAAAGTGTVQSFQIANASEVPITFATVRGIAGDITTGFEEGQLRLDVYANGNLVEGARLRGHSGGGVRFSFGGDVPAPLATVHIDQPSTTGAIPVLHLDQADISEEMLSFETTIGTGNAIEAVGAKTFSPTHFVKVTIPGGLTRYIELGTIA